MAVLYGLETIGNIMAGNIVGILICLALLLPIVAMAIWKKSLALRYYNYFIQAFIFVASIIGIIILAICIEIYDLPA